MAGAVFGDVGVSLFVVAFGDVAVALLAAGATFGDVGVSLFLAGAAFGETTVDSRSTKCRIFLYKLCLQSVKSKLGERCERDDHSSCSDHARISLASSAIVNDASSVSSRFSSYFGLLECHLRGRRSIW